MTKNLFVRLRKSTPWIGGGMLLQAGGCAFTGDELLQGLFSAIANNLLTGLVFGLFNVPASGI